LGQTPPAAQSSREQIVFDLLPGAVFCLATTAKPLGLAGDPYRQARAQSSWAISALSKVLLPEEIGPCSWRELAGRIHLDAREFLGSLSGLDRTRSRMDLLGALDAAKGQYPQVVIWTLLDRRRITLIPPG